MLLNSTEARFSARAALFRTEKESSLSYNTFFVTVLKATVFINKFKLLFLSIDNFFLYRYYTSLKNKDVKK